MCKEGSHVSMACWLLGCVDVLAAREHDAAWASDKQHAVVPNQNPCKEERMDVTTIAESACMCAAGRVV